MDFLDEDAVIVVAALKIGLVLMKLYQEAGIVEKEFSGYEEES